VTGAGAHRARRAAAALALLALALALAIAAAGCGGGDDGASSTAEEPRDRLEIVRDNGMSESVRVTLECEGADRELCAEIARLLPALQPDPDVACTEVYGGPETITVTGTLGGVPIETTVGREDGCAIDRYDRLDRVLSP
jgi:ABC-type glycerol-3-phosphate transport system substrate-binding protein